MAASLKIMKDFKSEVEDVEAELAGLIESIKEKDGKRRIAANCHLSLDCYLKLFKEHDY